MAHNLHKGCPECSHGGLVCRLTPTNGSEPTSGRACRSAYRRENRGRSFSESGAGAALQGVSAKPNPASGVKRFDPFHSMHYDAEEAEAAPTMWIDLLEGRVEPELPNRYDSLIVEFAGEVEEDRGRIFKKCSFFFGMWTKTIKVWWWF